jgi:hypothetical protein
MNMVKVRVTEAQASNLQARIRHAGLQVGYQTEQSGTLALILHDLSKAHTVRDVLAAEGIALLYDAGV